MPVKTTLDHAAVVRAAAALADQQGLEAVTLGAVAARLGIRPPSLYNHVAGLPGLRDSLALLGTRRLGDRLARAAIGKSADDAVIAIGHAYRTFAQEHPGLFAAAVRAPRPENAAWVEAARSVVDTVLAVLGAYNLSEDEALHAVRGLRALVHGFSVIESAGGFGLPLDLDVSFDYLLRLFTRGLRSAHAELSRAAAGA
jgi:AcrR family transcriptional regulator